jgi:hypothetical protein
MGARQVFGAALSSLRYFAQDRRQITRRSHDTAARSSGSRPDCRAGVV